MSGGPVVRRRIVLLDFFFVAFRFFTERVRVKLLGKVFDSRDNPRGGPIYGITDYRNAAFADRFHDTPSRKRGERFDGRGSGLGMRFRENQKVGVPPCDFLETNLGTVLCGIPDG